jgi:hypothetical protein
MKYQLYLALALSSVCSVARAQTEFFSPNGEERELERRC